MLAGHHPDSIDSRMLVPAFYATMIDQLGEQETERILTEVKSDEEWGATESAKEGAAAMLALIQ